MAHALRYYKEIQQDNGQIIRLEIHKKDSTLPAVEIGRVLQALHLDIQGGADTIDAPIVKTSLTMTFVDAPDLEEGKKCGDWEEFYTPDSTMWKVVLKADGKVIWGGYVTPDSYQEDLRYRGSVTIIARDNIGHMQDFPFDMEGNADGMVTLQELVNEAWAKIESPMTLDWRHEADDADYLLCDGVEAPQTYMNVSAFEEMNYFDAVEKALYAYGLVMRYTGSNRVAVMSLRDMPYQGKSGAPRPVEPTFLAHAQRELAPAARRIEESVKYEIIDVKQKLVKRTDYRGGSIEVPDYSGFTARVYPLDNSTEGNGWMNPLSTDPIYFNPAAYNLAEVSYSFPYTNDEKQNLPNTMMLLCNNRSGEAVFSRYVSAIDCQFNLVFGGRYFVEGPSSYNLLKQNQDYCRVTAFKYSVRVKKNGITNYLQEDGQWTATEAVLTVSDSNLDQVTIAVPFKDTGYVLLELVIKTIEVSETLANHYVAIQALRLGNISSNPMLERNNVNTIYDNENNVIIDHSPELAPAFNDTAIPGIINNGIFVKSGNAYLPAKKWAWSGGTPQQMAVYNHLQLLCYHSKPNNVISGDIVYADFVDMAAIYEWGGANHLLVSGSYNFLNGHIEGAVLREFKFYGEMWGDVSDDELPLSEQDNRTTAESGGASSNKVTYENTTNVSIFGGGGEGEMIIIDSEMSDTSTNPVQNKVIKAYVDRLPQYDVIGDGDNPDQPGGESLLETLKAYVDSKFGEIVGENGIFFLEDEATVGTKKSFFSESTVTAGGKREGDEETQGGLDIESLEEYLAEHQYATQIWVASQSYAKAADLSALSKKVDSLEGNGVDLTGYATEQWVKDQKYATSSSLDDAVTSIDTRLKAVEKLLEWFEFDKDENMIKAKFGIYSEGAVTAGDKKEE